MSEALAAAWEACLAHWDDPTTHDRVASLSLTVGEQPWVARHYRAVLRERPDDAIAATRLQRTGKIAQAAILATATMPRPGGYRRGSSLAVLLVLALVLAGGLLWGLSLARKPESTEPPSTTPRRTPAAGAHKPRATGSGTPARTHTVR